MKFYSSIAPFYNNIFPLNLSQVKFINDSFHDTDDLDILDVGCGVGTLIQELDKTYTNITGIDLDSEMIEIAKKRAYLNNPKVKIGNMLELTNQFNSQEFSIITCFGNTLVHLPFESDIHTFISQSFQLLKAGGKLLLQIINYDRIIENKVDSLPTIDNEKVNFIRAYEYLKDINKINFKTKLTIKENNQVIDNAQLLIPIRSSELVTILKEVGFKQVNVFGGFNRSLLTKESLPLVVKASK